MAKLKNIHPGEIILEEFLIPFNITAYLLILLHINLQKILIFHKHGFPKS
jgi:plasmid maintenance system antidote protein VapI